MAKSPPKFDTPNSPHPADLSNGQHITTDAGRPVSDIENSITAGRRGPVLQEDYIAFERLAHFNRERIPERVVHAKGVGAFGTFTVTHDITKYTRAKLFSKVGNTCEMLTRFSTVAGERGSADTNRDPRGFALKFYTEGGNWDLVGNNTPVFFVKDGLKFPDFIHSQKRDPRTNMRSKTMMWDFWSLMPESLHQVLILMSDRGTPYGIRHMHGYSSHTFSMFNADNVRTWVKFHFLTQQGIKNFTDAEAIEMAGLDPDFSANDLNDAITRGDFPKWKMFIQTMPDEQAATYKWNSFDVTKVWPHADFPLQEVGIFELNRMPENYHAFVEQAAYSPSNVVDGIGFSPDKMLQTRLLSYADAHRYRVGVNYEFLPANAPKAASHNNYHRDGAMALGNNGGSGPNYFPNSFNGPTEDKSVQEFAYPVEATEVRRYDRNAPGDDDHYTQPGDLFRLMTEKAQDDTIKNIVAHMDGIEGPKRKEIIERQLKLWFKVDEKLGKGVSAGLGVQVEGHELNGQMKPLHAKYAPPKPVDKMPHGAE
ncbi:catalase [Hymenobacter sp. BT507]|uniref:catalase n=1 Tax=Hymenobacter citatus TaxID=2763506 RepID=A0ABR7MK48_9BACT|nr:catalase [Hymenobacter citatus]MBC6611461.1 catalase [Hymenobacter citatus]